MLIIADTNNVSYDPEKQEIIIETKEENIIIIKQPTIGTIAGLWRRRKSLRKNRDIIHQCGGSRK